MTSLLKNRAALLALLLAATASAADIQKPIDVPALPQAAPISGAAASVLPGAEAVGPDALIPGALGTAAAPQAGTPAAAAASVESAAKAIAPQVEAVAAPASSDGDAAAAGRNAETILQGGKASDAAGVVLAAAGAAGTPSLMAAPAVMAHERAKGGVPAAAKAPEEGPRRVDSRLGYAARRFALNALASAFGVVASLPVAGPRLTNVVLRRLSYQDALLSDIDDTLVKFNSVLEPQTVDAIIALRRSGKFFAAITDRPDKARPGSSTLSAFDSLASIPAAERAGIVVATNGGGKIYQYDAQGEPKLIFEEPALPEAEVSKVHEAAEAVKARLPELGAKLHSYSDNPYGMAMLLEVGTPEAAVKEIAQLMENEMRARGLSYEVEGRMAKDAKNPPYITFSKLDKSLAVRRIVELEKLDPMKTTPIGDSMYKPQLPVRVAGAAARAVRWAERLSGRPIPLTGNETDRNMERAIPGALTISVGLTGDPRMSRAFVLDGKGPELTRRVIRAMASRPKGTEHPSSIVPAILIISMTLATLGGMIHMASQGVERLNQAAVQDYQQSVKERPF